MPAAVESAKSLKALKKERDDISHKMLMMMMMEQGRSCSGAALQLLNLALFSALLFTIVAASAAEFSTYYAQSDQQQLAAVKAAYWPSYSAQTYPASSIDASLFTHLLFAFVEFDLTSFEVKPPDSATQRELIAFTHTLKASNPDVQTLISIGGGDASPSNFAKLAANPSSRNAFVASSIAMARQYGFAGLDLDWEFPQTPSEMDNLRLLISDWRAAILSEANQSGVAPLMLTAAVYYASLIPDDTPRSYPVASIAADLDWINIMAYDYHGSWDHVTGEHTALYATYGSNLSTDYGVGTWLKAGLPEQKIVLGLASYGRSWILANASQPWGVGAPAVGPGPKQPLSQEAGVFTYTEIVDFIRNSNVSTVYDDLSVCVYSSDGRIWIGYDNAVSIANKSEYVMSQNLRGYFFWTVSFDSNWTLSKTAFTTTSNYSSSVEPVPPTGAPSSYVPPLSSGTNTISSSPFKIVVMFLLCNGIQKFI